MGLDATVHTVILSSDNATTPEVGTLRYFINNAANGDTILFAVAQVSLEASLSIPSKTLTIDGGEGVVLDGNRAVRVLSITYNRLRNVILRNLTIQNGYLQGESSDQGGGIYATGSGEKTHLLIENCIFRNNEVACNGTGQGGALRAQGGTFINCTFLNNSVSGSGVDNSGGAVYAEGSNFINCFFAGNSAQKAGGLFVTSRSNLTNCTITQNTTNGGQGAGLYLDNFSKCDNSILYGNLNGSTSNNVFTSYSNLTYCALEQGNGLVGTSGNIGLGWNPFADPYNGDFHLSEGDICIDAGKSGLVVGATRDLAGNARITGSAVDMGAYETDLPIVISGTLQSQDGTPLPNYTLHNLKC